MTPRVRVLDGDEAEGLVRMARSRSLGAGLVRWAQQIVRHAVQGGLSAACRGWKGTRARDGRRPTRPRSGRQSRVSEVLLAGPVTAKTVAEELGGPEVL